MKPVADVLEAQPDEVLLWRPRAGYDRMLAQQSVLGLATLTANAWGSFGFGSEKPALRLPRDLQRVGHVLIGIAVPPELKRMMHEEGEALLGYSGAVLFPDLPGFS